MGPFGVGFEVIGRFLCVDPPLWNLFFESLLLWNILQEFLLLLDLTDDDGVCVCVACGVVWGADADDGWLAAMMRMVMVSGYSSAAIRYRYPLPTTGE